jgi:uncharacterized membrane protein
MNREQFIKTLSSQLDSLSEKERQELLGDYQTHFDIGLIKGKSEQQISSELGDPLQLAKEVLGESKPPVKKKSEDIFRSILVVIAIVFLNINLVIPLVFSLFGVWLGLSIISILFSLALPISLIGFIIVGSFHVAIGFIAIGLMGCGILLAIPLWFAAKYAWVWIKKYVIWNINFVKGSL